jgi:hypothetical protein
MRLRHFAMVLVGWYLMLPPVKCTLRPNVVEGNVVTIPEQCAVEPDSPLHEWDMAGSFDSADDCEASRESVAQTTIKQLRRDLRATLADKPQLMGPAVTATHEASQDARCIGTNDPRLR